MILLLVAESDQSVYMDVIHSPKQSPEIFSPSLSGHDCDKVQSRLQQWQQARSWARLIREAENLWHVESRVVRRLGALELSQLLEEVPPVLRPRVNRWLNNYSAATRLNCNVRSLGRRKL